MTKSYLNYEMFGTDYLYIYIVTYREAFGSILVV